MMLTLSLKDNKWTAGMAKSSEREVYGGAKGIGA